MKFLNVEHLTRYMISKDDKQYIRLVEKSIEEQVITWFHVEEGIVFAVETPEPLEIEFISTLS